MGRVVDGEVARLQVEVAVERLAQARGVVLRIEGGELVGCCPFHVDDRDSLVVDAAGNSWRCRGVCGAGGGPVEWVMRAEGISQRHAVELLRAGATPTAGGRPPRQGTVRRLASPLLVDADDVDLLAQVVAFYGQTLKESPDALGWLAEHGLDDPALLDHFKVGFSNRTLGYRLPAKNRRDGKVLRDRLQTLGVLRASGHEHFRGALTVPVVDETGAVTQVYGHRVGRVREDRSPDGAVELWLPGERRGVFNPDALASSEVIVAGSVLDALTLWCAGFRHVTALVDADGLVDAFARHGTTRALLAMGRPDGDRTAVSLAQRLGAAGVECFRVTLPRGVDVNTFALDAPAPADALGRLLRAATWMGSGPSPRRTTVDAPPPRRAEPVPDAPAPVEPGPAGPVPVEPWSVSPLPPPPQLDVELVGAELRATLGDRRWRVRGLERVSSFDVLRLNVLVGRDDAVLGELFHVDTLDLYSARARAAFVHAAAAEIRVTEEVLRRDLGRVLVACEERATEAITAAQAPTDTTVTLSAEERTAALGLLRDPNLIERIVADVGRVGVVGEATNVMVGYLAAVSRKLDAPLAVLIQSSSAAGKSSLMEAILALVPGEDRVKFSAMTGQSLFYVGEAALAHKLLAVAEEEGASRAAYALKLLQSEGELSIASTGKDSASGRMTTHTYRVEGPVALFLTTTAADVDEELANRCIVLTVDEDRDQTRAIHQRQRARQTLDGLLADHERRAVIKLHQDAQRLLEPVLVANPYAPQLTFADERTRMRRDHLKYLTLIRTVALLHQHQRPRRTVVRDGVEVAYIEVTVADIALANRLAHQVLGRSLDELAPQTRRLLHTLERLVTERARDGEVGRGDVRFTRREARTAAGWSDFQVRVHLGRLVDLEYVLVHRGGRGQSFVYELLYDGGGTDGQPHLIGLTDPTGLRSCGYDPNPEPAAGEVEGSSSPQRAPIEPTLSGTGNGRSPAAMNGNGNDGTGEQPGAVINIGPLPTGRRS